MQVTNLSCHDQAPVQWVHDNRLLSLDYEPSLALVCLGSYDNNLYFLPNLIAKGTDAGKQVIKGKRVRQQRNSDLLAHDNYITAVSFGTKDPNSIYSSSYDGTLKRWDVTTCKELQSFSVQAEVYFERIGSFCKRRMPLTWICLGLPLPRYKLRPIFNRFDCFSLE